jgi:hypothetical protein
VIAALCMLLVAGGMLLGMAASALVVMWQLRKAMRINITTTDGKEIEAVVAGALLATLLATLHVRSHVLHKDPHHDAITSSGARSPYHCRPQAQPRTRAFHPRRASCTWRTRPRPDATPAGVRVPRRRPRRAAPGTTLIRPAPIVAVTAATRVRRVWSSPFTDAFSILEVFDGERLLYGVAVWWA